MNKILNAIKLKKVYIPLVFIVVVIGSVIFFGGNSNKDYQTAQVVKSDFAQEVSVTGKVVAADDVTLAFETSGRIARVSAIVGTKFSKGASLASLGNGDLYAVLLQRQATLQAEQAELDELKNGTRPEELQIAESNFEQSEIALEDSIIESFVDSENAVRNNTDIFFRNPESSNPDLIDFSDYDDKTRIENTRIDIGDMLEKWKKSNTELEASGFEEKYINEARSNLSMVRSYLDELVGAVSDMESEGSIDDATIVTYKSNLSAARISVGNAISSLNSADQSYRNAKNNLALKEAGSTFATIQVQQATVKSAEAGVIQAQSALGDSVITAPFDGIVTKVDLSVGEFVSSGAPAINMISAANFEIESFIPEADIAKIIIGNKANVTLDAYGDKIVFPAIITEIDLSDTEVEGVSTYKTILQFEKADDRIKSGMTANIDIQNEVRKDVLNIPQSALINTEGIKTVLVMDDGGKTKSQTIKTGSLDGLGNIEIIEGLNEGDRVVTNPPKKP